jgi:Protein of unknown function with HXXEE motif
MVINTSLAYPFCLAPVLFPMKRWLGLAPVLVGWSQIVLHGIVIPRKAGAKYGPGILTALLLHLPIGIGYLKAVGQHGPIGRKDCLHGQANGSIRCRNQQRRRTRRGLTR